MSASRYGCGFTMSTSSSNFEALLRINDRKWRLESVFGRRVATWVVYAAIFPTEVLWCCPYLQGRKAWLRSKTKGNRRRLRNCIAMYFLGERDDCLGLLFISVRTSTSRDAPSPIRLWIHESQGKLLVQWPMFTRKATIHTLLLEMSYCILLHAKVMTAYWKQSTYPWGDAMIDT